MSAPLRPGGPSARIADVGERGGPDVADELLDELLPRSLDWRHLVRTYPHAAVAIAVAAGFWLGRSKSHLILAAAGSYLAAQVGDAVVGLGERSASTD